MLWQRAVGAGAGLLGPTLLAVSCLLSGLPRCDADLLTMLFEFGGGGAAEDMMTALRMLDAMKELADMVKARPLNLSYTMPDGTSPGWRFCAPVPKIRLDAGVMDVLNAAGPQGQIYCCLAVPLGLGALGGELTPISSWADGPWRSTWTKQLVIEQYTAGGYWEMREGRCEVKQGEPSGSGTVFASWPSSLPLPVGEAQVQDPKAAFVIEAVESLDSMMLMGNALADVASGKVQSVDVVPLTNGLMQLAAPQMYLLQEFAAVAEKLPKSTDELKDKVKGLRGKFDSEVAGPVKAGLATFVDELMSGKRHRELADKFQLISGLSTAGVLLAASGVVWAIRNLRSVRSHVKQLSDRELLPLPFCDTFVEMVQGFGVIFFTVFLGFIRLMIRYCCFCSFCPCRRASCLRQSLHDIRCWSMKLHPVLLKEQEEAGTLPRTLRGWLAAWTPSRHIWVLTDIHTARIRWPLLSAIYVAWQLTKKFGNEGTLKDCKFIREFMLMELDLKNLYEWATIVEYLIVLIEGIVVFAIFFWVFIGNATNHSPSWLVVSIIGVALEGCWQGTKCFHRANGVKECFPNARAFDAMNCYWEIAVRLMLISAMLRLLWESTMNTLVGHLSEVERRSARYVKHRLQCEYTTSQRQCMLCNEILASKNAEGDHWKKCHVGMVPITEWTKTIEEDVGLFEGMQLAKMKGFLVDAINITGRPVQCAEEQDTNAVGSGGTSGDGAAADTRLPSESSREPAQASRQVSLTSAQPRQVPASEPSTLRQTVSRATALLTGSPVPEQAQVVPGASRAQALGAVQASARMAAAFQIAAKRRDQKEIKVARKASQNKDNEVMSSDGESDSDGEPVDGAALNQRSRVIPTFIPTLLWIAMLPPILYLAPLCMREIATLRSFYNKSRDLLGISERFWMAAAPGINHAQAEALLVVGEHKQYVSATPHPTFSLVQLLAELSVDPSPLMPALGASVHCCGGLKPTAKERAIVYDCVDGITTMVNGFPDDKDAYDAVLFFSDASLDVHESRLAKRIKLASPTGSPCEEIVYNLTSKMLAQNSEDAIKSLKRALNQTDELQDPRQPFATQLWTILDWEQFARVEAVCSFTNIQQVTRYIIDEYVMDIFPLPDFVRKMINDKLAEYLGPFGNIWYVYHTDNRTQVLVDTINIIRRDVHKDVLPLVYLGLVVAKVLAFLYILFLMVILSRTYRVKIAQLMTQKGSYTLRTIQRRRTSRNLGLFEATVFPGYVCTTCFIAFFLIQYVLIAIFVGIALCCLDATRPIVWASIKPMLKTLLVMIFVKVVILKEVFFRRVIQDESGEVRRHWLYSIAVPAFMLCNFLIGSLFGVLRFAIGMICAMFACTRVDVLVVPESIEFLDWAHYSFMSVVLMSEKEYCPVKRMALRCFMGRGLYGSWQLREIFADADDQQAPGVTASASAEGAVLYYRTTQQAKGKKKLNEVLDEEAPEPGQSVAAERMARRAQAYKPPSRALLRWHLALTLARNPILQLSRKKRIIADRERLEEESIARSYLQGAAGYAGSAWQTIVARTARTPRAEDAQPLAEAAGAPAATASAGVIEMSSMRLASRRTSGDTAGGGH